MNSCIADMAERAVANIEYARAGKVTTVCTVTLDNGFEVVGTSAVANPEDFDVEIGRTCALEEAMSMVYELMAFRLKEKTVSISIPLGGKVQVGEPVEDGGEGRAFRIEDFRSVPSTGEWLLGLEGDECRVVSAAWVDEHRPAVGDHVVEYPGGSLRYAPTIKAKSTDTE